MNQFRTRSQNWMLQLTRHCPQIQVEYWPRYMWCCVNLCQHRSYVEPKLIRLSPCMTGSILQSKGHRDMESSWQSESHHLSWYCKAREQWVLTTLIKHSFSAFCKEEEDSHNLSEDCIEFLYELLLWIWQCRKRRTRGPRFRPKEQGKLGCWITSLESTISKATTISRSENMYPFRFKMRFREKSSDFSPAFKVHGGAKRILSRSYPQFCTVRSVKLKIAGSITRRADWWVDCLRWSFEDQHVIHICVIG